MYLFKFFKWFWIDYLSEPVDRVMVGLFTWMGTTGVLGILSAVTKIHTIFYVWMTFSISAIAIIGIVAGIIFVRNRYREWQDQVFDKLREEPKGYTDE